MARIIQDFTNVTAPSPTYPDGRIKDNTGANDGTPVDEQAYGDIHVFFAQLLRRAGITRNSLPENEANGYQFIEALFELSDRYACASTSSVAIGTGLKTFTVPANMDYALNQYVRITSASNTLNYMAGLVFSYTVALGVGTLVVFVDDAGGSGTHANWNIRLSGRAVSDQNAVNAGTNVAGIVTPATLALAKTVMGVDGGIGLRTKIVQIGDWNMDSTQSVTIAHGLTYGNIRSVAAFIRNDANASVLPIDAANPLDWLCDGRLAWSSSSVVLSRRPSGFFDDNDYSATSYNRGFIVIEYIA